MHILIAYFTAHLLANRFQNSQKLGTPRWDALSQVQLKMFKTEEHNSGQEFGKGLTGFKLHPKCLMRISNWASVSLISAGISKECNTVNPDLKKKPTIG